MLTLLERNNMRSIVYLMFEQGKRQFDIWTLPDFKDNTFFVRYNRSKLTEFDQEFVEIIDEIAPDYKCRYVTTLQRYPGIHVYEDSTKKISSFADR